MIQRVFYFLQCRSTEYGCDVVYIRKRLNIFVFLPSGAGAEGRGGVMMSRQPSLTCRSGSDPGKMEEERFEALLLLQVHREDTPSVDAVLDHFAATSARRLKFIL